MAENRRGKHSGVKRKGATLKAADRLGMVCASSDDEGPEEVTFEDSKAAALRTVKEAIKTAKRNKEELKEKRRRRHELFQEQKKRRRLPDEILQEIESATSEVTEVNDEGTGSGGVEESRTCEKEDVASVYTMKTAKNRSIEGGYMITRLKDQPDGSKQKDTAAGFIQDRLYGPGSRRIPVSQFLSLEQKKSQNKGAAVQFKRQWRGKQEDEAVKFKKRWLHKQKAAVS